jgi:hypothetical protein
LNPEHIEELRAAKQVLEHPGLTARLTTIIGTPIEKGIALLPRRWSATINAATQKSLGAALRLAVSSIGTDSRKPPRNLWHKAAATASGAGGGAWGLLALAVELPISTTVMLRSIAEIARSNGEDLRRAEAQLACLEVFALGGRTSRDNAAESGYFAVRTALARAVAEAAEFIAERGLTKEGAPAIVRLITLIAGRFGITVSEKAAAQSVPVVGALGGALINLAFTHHFQEMARGHFTVRRLERIYGREEVRNAYVQLGEEWKRS